jgi:hypothetical protein
MNEMDPDSVKLISLEALQNNMRQIDFFQTVLFIVSGVICGKHGRLL